MRGRSEVRREGGMGVLCDLNTMMYGMHINSFERLSVVEKKDELDVLMLDNIREQFLTQRMARLRIRSERKA